MAGVAIDSIKKSFDQQEVLKNVDLEIIDGEFLTLVGPSGCGKTTLLRIIAGLERQTAGSIQIGGRAVDELAPSRRDVAMVFQSYALYPHMTVRQNIGLPLTIRRLNFFQRFPIIGKFVPGARAILREIESEIQTAAVTLGLENLLDRKPRQLSGGQRQRVAVGRALVRHPKVFLLDEPLSNLDAELRVQMRSEIIELHKRLGVTFIYVTHDQVEAMTMSDRVVVMMEGDIIQVGTPAELYENPQFVRVAKFIGSPKINILEGIVLDDGSLAIGDYVVDRLVGRPAGTKIQVGIRPENIEVGKDQHSGFRCIVRRREYLGSDLYLFLEPEGGFENVIMRATVDQARKIESGEIVYVRANEKKVLLFDQDGRRIGQNVDNSQIGNDEQQRAAG
jgi:multiple sugar transport system ATP-binding protein